MIFGRVNEWYGFLNVVFVENFLMCINFNKFFFIICNGNKFWIIIYFLNFNEEKILKVKEVKFKSRYKCVVRYSRK